LSHELIFFDEENEQKMADMKDEVECYAESLGNQNNVHST